jgi:hypothetical protein
MIYHSPAELKDLWGRFEKMRAQITQEQEVARAEQSRRDAEIALRKRQIRNALQNDLIWLFVLLIIALETYGVLWTILLHQENRLPSWPGL